MPKFRVDWTEYRFAIIDADTKEDAIEIAENMNVEDSEYSMATDYIAEEVKDEDA